MNLSKKANSISPSITLEITGKANELKAQGVNVMSFAAGEPDFNTPRNIIEAAIKAMDDGYTKYTKTSGIVELRKAICKKLHQENNLNYSEEQIVVSTGAKQCLANTFLAILNKGDEVILQNPCWVSYTELIKLADGVPVIVNCDENDGYKLSAKNIEKAVTSKTKAILLNSPHNPTGIVYKKNELEEIAQIAKKYNLIIISDEIYEKLIYDGEEHVSIASLSEDAYERTIVINGLSKTYAMTGWRVGYTASSTKLAKVMSSVQSHMTSNVCSISQYAALEALTGPQDSINMMKNAFEERRNFMMKKLEGIDEVSFIKPQGAFYIMVDITYFIGKSINGIKINNSIEFAKILLEEEKVAVIPGAAFGLENFIRLSYATSMEVIEEGLDRIKSFLGKLK
ncbi:MAG: pyridoxal phosphate-dependent aminotransferase [Clostridium sp.]|jgi:aspartate aminotransferase|uniref:pyridoxal phosphate-dependent aminotransferase n=1 Tax=Clostridium sp. TaxID=1506 RepID=UPI002671EAB3|nr:pyridoxal phosphate-dependent aminotransferase [Clostridium sp.]MCI7031378.1 pyridoxal phosphate-dependent aminotransferase [Clostridium sp.]MDD7683749.1 pyridoxal phosphate-dependent aminotransferase [Clostridium sp.]MDY2581191.1 pyridoxal phosphate-dependent aminotransferase [Clostridium sp.]